MVMLNETELKVFKAMADEVLTVSGGDFGFMESVDRCGLSKHQFAGFVGSLVKKNLVTPADEGLDQFMIRTEAGEILVALGFDPNKFDLF